MLETLISSKTRVKLLLKFFLNSNTTSYLRGLESEFGESSNSIRLELNRLENAGMLSSSMEGNKKVFRANTAHPLFDEVHNILLKYVGLDQIVDKVINQLGEVKEVYVTGTFAKGLNNQIIDLLFIGDVNRQYLLSLTERVEKLIHRKIRYVIYGLDEYEGIDWDAMEVAPLLLWKCDE